MKQVAGTGLKNPLGWNLSYMSSFRPSPNTNQIPEPNQYGSCVGLWHQDGDQWQWCPGITNTQLQVRGATTSVRHNYKYEVQLQV